MEQYCYDPYTGQPLRNNRPQQAQGNQQGNPWSTSPGFTCRPVTSREEAVAAQVDFLGPGSIMPDFGHGMIYFKRFNPGSGSAEFYEFSLLQPQQQTPQPVSQGPVYDPREDIDALRGDISAIRNELDDLKKSGSKRTGGKAVEG